MSYFPDIRAPSSIEETTSDPSIRTEFESGIVQTRARYTRLRRTWELTWAAITNSEYGVLRAFYVAQHGGSLIFEWHHPYENTNYSVRFKGELKAKNSQLNYWNLTITLEES